MPRAADDGSPFGDSSEIAPVQAAYCHFPKVLAPDSFLPFLRAFFAMLFRSFGSAPRIGVQELLHFAYQQIHSRGRLKGDENVRDARSRGRQAEKTTRCGGETTARRGEFPRSEGLSVERYPRYQQQSAGRIEAWPGDSRPSKRFRASSFGVAAAGGGRQPLRAQGRTNLQARGNAPVGVSPLYRRASKRRYEAWWRRAN